MCGFETLSLVHNEGKIRGKNQVRSNRCWDSEVKAPGGEEHKENKIIKQKISHLIHCRLLRQWTVMLLMMLGLMAKEK